MQYNLNSRLEVRIPMMRTTSRLVGCPRSAGRRVVRAKTGVMPGRSWVPETEVGSELQGVWGLLETLACRVTKSNVAQYGCESGARILWLMRRGVAGVAHQSGEVARLRGDRIETYWELQRVTGDHNIIILYFQNHFLHKHSIVLILQNSVSGHISATNANNSFLLNVKQFWLLFINQTERKMLV